MSFHTSKLRKKNVFQEKRSLFFQGTTLILFLFFIFRASWLALFSTKDENLSRIKKNQYEKTSNLVAYRGTISDHKNVPLAISIQLPSLAVNPQIFRPSKKELKALSTLLDTPQEDITALSRKKGYFAWLKRKITYAVDEEVKALSIRGVFHTLEPSRFYPGNNSAAHLIGLVGTDNTGLLGLERVYNRTLAGESTEVKKLRDARGQSIFTHSDSVVPQEAGHNIFLTLDHVIQEITEEALEKKYTESLASSAFAIVADPHTGRILAIANKPGFNPNNTEELIMKNTTNLSVTSVFEPGSVSKSFVIAQALETGKTTPTVLHDCEKSGVYKISPSVSIHDDFPKNHPMTTSEVLIYSSNICSYKISQKIGKDDLYKTLKRFGIGKKITEISLPGLTTGFVSPAESWKEIRFANIAFGQGYITTGLEMIRAYSVFANGGFLVEPYLVGRVETAEGELIKGPAKHPEKRVLSAKVAEQMREMLSRVVAEGSGRNAQLESFSAAGKTGTTEKVDPETKAYSSEKRLASFVGFAPAMNPHLVAYIVIDEPHKKPYYGGTWAAPVFKDIMDKSLKYLNIAPETSPAQLPKTTETQDKQASHDTNL